MKTYIGTKIIKAEPMDSHTYQIEKQGKVDRGDENAHGYKVQYPDGYVSWSPKATFEEVYREITPNETALVRR